MATRDPENRKAYRREYYQKNKEKLAAQTLAWRQRNPEKVKETQKRWRQSEQGKKKRKEAARKRLQYLKEHEPWLYWERQQKERKRNRKPWTPEREQKAIQQYFRNTLSKKTRKTLEKVYHAQWRLDNADYHKRWYAENKDKYREYVRRKFKGRDTRLLRYQALLKMGGKCVQCGNTDLHVLQIDHIEPLHKTGRKRPSSHTGGTFYLRILEPKTEASRKLRDELQLLCANCHLRKTTMEIEGILELPDNLFG